MPVLIFLGGILIAAFHGGTKMVLASLLAGVVGFVSVFVLVAVAAIFGKRT